LGDAVKRSVSNGKPPGATTLVTNAVSGHASGEPVAAPDLAAVREEADIAEAEAVEAEALAAAARARARAIRLRRDAEQAAAAEDEPAVTDAVDTEPAPSARARRGGLRSRRLHRSRWITVAVVVSTMLIGASGAAAGTVWWQHREATQNRQRSVEFAAAARQGVVNLMSLNHETAKDDVQRLINNTTDDFRRDLESTRDDFISVVKDSKVATACTVNATAVQSMSNDSAVVLVAATSEVTNAAGARRDPRTWRLSVTVTRDGGRLKMSKVEFVP
jgi:Mce-associated membrane protein